MSFSHIPNTVSMSYWTTFRSSFAKQSQHGGTPSFQPNSHNPKTPPPHHALRHQPPTPHPAPRPSRPPDSSGSSPPARTNPPLGLSSAWALQTTPPAPPPAPHRVAAASLLWPLSPRPPASCGRSSCFAPPPPYLRRSTCTPWRRRKKGPGRGSLTNRGDCGLAGGDRVYCWAAALSVSSQSAQRNRISGVLRHFRQRPWPLLLRPP